MKLQQLRYICEIARAGLKVSDAAANLFTSQPGISKEVAREFADEGTGSLSIATTHTQACYALPDTIQRFRAQYPRISLHIHMGTPQQIAEMAARSEVDFAIATEALELLEDLVTLPCYHWNHCVVAPVGHPVLKESPLTLERLATYPIVTYVYGFTGRSKIGKA